MPGIVAAGHQETASAAAEVLKSGGNAFDAAIAAFWTACVVEPALTSPAGGGFLLARPAGESSRLYDFFVQTPQSKRASQELHFFEVSANFGKVTQDFHIGMGSVATPGNTMGMFKVHSDLGSMPMSELVGFAAQLARDGFAIDPFQSFVLDVIHPIYLASPGARRIFASEQRDGHTKQPGEHIANPEFADFLEQLARDGYPFFYEGELAEEMDRMSRHSGGHLSKTDLSDYQVIVRDPLTHHIGKSLLTTNPLPSSGGALIAFGMSCVKPLLSGQIFGSTEHLTALAETMAATELARKFASHDLHRLLDPVAIQAFRDQVHSRAASFKGTTHISIADGFGNLASVTTSNGEGSGDLIPGCGFMFNNMLGEEDLNPMGFHNWTVNQRMTSMMAPSFVDTPNQTIVLGSGGSNRIRTAILQVLVNLLEYDMSIEEAVCAPDCTMKKKNWILSPVYLARKTSLPAIKIIFAGHNRIFSLAVHTLSSLQVTRFRALAIPGAMVW